MAKARPLAALLLALAFLPLGWSQGHHNPHRCPTFETIPCRGLHG